METANNFILADEEVSEYRSLVVSVVQRMVEQAGQLFLKTLVATINGVGAQFAEKNLFLSPESFFFRAAGMRSRLRSQSKKKTIGWQQEQRDLWRTHISFLFLILLKLRIRFQQCS